MGAGAADSAGASGSPFAHASPAEVRAALTSEDAAAFDEHWRAVMKRATESLDLTELFEALDAWRRTAWLTSARGHDGYRRMLAQAEDILRTRRAPAGTVPWSQLKVELGLAE